jgi:hypothetical protein
MQDHTPVWRQRAVRAAFILLASLTVQAAAQPDSSCTWDRCALRLHRGFLGARLVRGLGGEQVAGLGLFPSAVPLFAERSDSAAIRYDAFRSKQTVGSGLVIAGLAALFAGAAVLSADHAEVGGALALAGFGLSLGGGIVASAGQNDLARAVWWYNRTFANEEPPSPAR